MFTTLAENSKAAIFTVIVLLLAVTVAASINLFSITSEFLSIVLYMFTPALTVLIMMLVVTREGFSREGWKLLGLHRLGLKAWWIAPPFVNVLRTSFSAPVAGLRAELRTPKTSARSPKAPPACGACGKGASVQPR
jgi:uncharacterized protein